MQISDKAKTLLTAWEGSERKEYLDSAGLPTIGVGHLLTAAERAAKQIVIGGAAVSYADGLTDAQVRALLSADLARFETAVSTAVKVALTQNQFDALVVFAFNVGVPAFEGSTLVQSLNAGKYDAVPTELRRWVKSDGKTVQGLVNRRENEIKLWNAAA
jgi:lysozyme